MDEFRIGQGYDAHRLKTGRKLILGGVELPFVMGLDGHSDADVLVHALMDALLGAAAQGDIGKLFPDTDEEFLNISSLTLLRRVKAVLADAGWCLGNADMTIVAQRPKLAPYIGAMRENIAAALCCDVARISVKATTEEGMGFTGNGEGIAAQAIVLLYRL